MQMSLLFCSLPALLLSFLVFTSLYFSLTEDTEHPQRHTWSNMPLTALHTILLKLCNKYQLLTEKFPSQLKGL